MTLVTIVMVPNADNTGPDYDRLEKVEDVHPEIARNMLQYGTARQPSEEELAEYHKARGGGDQEQAVEDEQPTPAEASAGPTRRNGKTQPEPAPTVETPAAE